MCCSQGGTFIYHIHSHIFKVVIFYCASCFEPKIWCFLNADLPPKATSLHMKKLRGTTSHYVYFNYFYLFYLFLPVLITTNVCSFCFECPYYHSQSLVLLRLSLLNVLPHHLIQYLHENLQSQDNKTEYIDTSTWSMIFVSAEKRFRISPSGVMSKNLLDKLKPKSYL